MPPRPKDRQSDQPDRVTTRPRDTEQAVRRWPEVVEVYDEEWSKPLFSDELVLEITKLGIREEAQ